MPNSTPPVPLFDGRTRCRPGRGSKPAALMKARVALLSLAVTLAKLPGVTNQIGCAALLRATNAGCMAWRVVGMLSVRSVWLGDDPKAAAAGEPAFTSSQNLKLTFAGAGLGTAAAGARPTFWVCGSRA